MTKRKLNVFANLEAHFASLVALGAIVRMEGDAETDSEEIAGQETRIREMREDIAHLTEENATIFAKIDDEKRDASDDEDKTVKENQAEIKRLTRDIERRQEHIDQLRADSEPNARLSDPEPSDDDDTIDDDDEPVQTARQRRASRRSPPTNSDRRSSRQRTDVQPLRIAPGMLGFNSGSHFMEDVRAAAGGFQSDKLRNCLLQMQKRMDANASFGEDGAFPIPPDIANDIKKKVDGSANLVGLCSRWDSKSDRYVWFLDEDEPWKNTDGVTGTWLDEGDTIPLSQPNLTKMQTDLHKYAIAVRATHEVLRNSSQMEQLIRTSAPANIAEELNRVILDGDGIGKPLGIYRSGALAIRAKESGQTAATVVRKNVNGAHNLVHAQCRTNPAFKWVANSDVEPELEEMVGADNRPIYLPGNSMATAPHMVLKGREVIYTPHAKALGDVGDLAAIDFSKYLIVFGENLRSDFSIHAQFLQDKGVFRFIIYVGGRPKWGQPITEPNSATARSFAAAVAQRA